MGKVTYEQARADHEYLWSIAPAYDMTGGYVDSGDLERLLQSPTKTTARDCYVNQIVYWLQIGPEDSAYFDVRKSDAQEWIDKDPKVAEIAERYGEA